MVPSVTEWSKAPEYDASAGGESLARAPVRSATIGWWGQGQHNKLCFVRALIPQIRPINHSNLISKKGEERNNSYITANW